jgi:hypothetical protein
MPKWSIDPVVDRSVEDEIARLKAPEIRDLASRIGDGDHPRRGVGLLDGRLAGAALGSRSSGTPKRPGR